MRLPKPRDPIKFLFGKLSERAIQRRISKLYKFYEEHWGRPLTLDDKIAILRSSIEALEWWAQQDKSKINREAYLRAAEAFRRELEKLEKLKQAGGENQ